MANLSLELLSAGRSFSEILGEAVSAIGMKPASPEKRRSSAPSAPGLGHAAAAASQRRFVSVAVRDTGVFSPRHTAGQHPRSRSPSQGHP